MEGSNGSLLVENNTTSDVQKETSGEVVEQTNDQQNVVDEKKGNDNGKSKKSEKVKSKSIKKEEKKVIEFDDEVSRENSLKKQVSQLNTEINTKIDEIKKISESLPKNEDVSVLVKELSKLNQQLSETKKKMSKLSAIRKKTKKTVSIEDLQTQVKAIEMKIESYALSVEKKEEEKKGLETHSAILKSKVSKLKKKLPYTSIMDYEREISSLNDQKNKCEDDKEKTKVITKKIKSLQKAKNQYNEYYENWESHVMTQQNLMKLNSDIQELNKKISAQEKEKKEIEEQLSETKHDETDKAEVQFQELKNKAKDLDKQIQALEGEKKEAEHDFRETHRELFEKRDILQKDLNTLKEKRNTIQSKMTGVSNKLVTYKIKFNPDLYGYVVGRKGENVKDIMFRSHANVLVSQHTGIITIRGTKDSADEAKRRVENLLKNNKTTTEYVQFKFSHFDIIKRASRYIKSESKVKDFFADKYEGAVRITGTKVAIETAKKLISEEIENNVYDKEQITIPTEHCDLIAKRLNGIRKTTRINKLYLEKGSGNVSMEGYKKSIKDAKKGINELVDLLSKGKEELKLSEEQYKLLTKFRNHDYIENQTKTFVFYEREKMSAVIYGDTTSIGNAKSEIEKLSKDPSNYPSNQPKAPTKNHQPTTTNTGK